MSGERIRSVFFLILALNALRAITRDSDFGVPPLLGLVVLVGLLLYFFHEPIFGFVRHNSLLYKLRRTHGKIIDKIARPFGKPGLLEQAYLHVRAPRWCRRSQDDLLLIYRDQKKLMDEGHTVLAMVVQAQAALFKKGFHDAPANVIYMGEPVGENPLQTLGGVAHRIFGLKGTTPEDPDERKFAGMVSYEYGRDFRVTVPDKLADGLDVTYTTIMVHRKHLPQGYLANGFFPLLVHQESRAAMILPARYWSKELLSDWGVS